MGIIEETKLCLFDIKQWLLFVIKGPAQPGITSDWTSTARASHHIFVPSTSGEEACYLGSDCISSKSARMKCTICKIVSHSGCNSRLQEDFPCKATFKENIRDYREESQVEHHWVTRKKIKGKCRSCAKTFQTKPGTGVCCSWCSLAYHTTGSCQEAFTEDKVCGLGIHSGIIVPPTWILKLPRKGYIQSSLKLEKSEERETTEYDRNYIIKPVPVSNCSPLIVFLNPKSGGNQGVKLLQRFQSLLNPRQVFDLTQGGPGPAIEMYKRVPGVRFLACGGDGTAGWVLSVLDKIQVTPTPPVGVLPLGTGNDLSRSLGWGGGYMDESISDILVGIQSADIISMDRWRLDCTPSTEHPATEKGVDQPPLNVVNNYFSMGVDAQIALQFHEAREANPQKFSSRIRNKIYYGQAGGKDLLLAKWKKLSEFITLECDGVDYTPKLRELKIHSVLFLNISCFGSGTRPWNRASGVQKLDDGLMEVIGLTTYQLPLLQAGGHGHCIAQCKTATVSTTKTIPVQVDGEAARLNPCTIQISLLNKARMLAKKKSRNNLVYELENLNLTVEVHAVSMNTYEEYYLNKEKLLEHSRSVGSISLDSGSQLKEARTLIMKLQDDSGSGKQKLGQDFTFLDIITARNCFRIDSSKEKSYFLMDVCEKTLLVLDSSGSSHCNGDNNNTVMSGDVVNGSSPAAGRSASPAAVGRSASPASGRSASPAGGRSPDTSKPTTLHIESFLSPADDTFHLSVPSLRDNCQILEKTSEGVLKAARLGDMAMLKDLHEAGYSLLSIDETAKTALHYAARFGNKEVVKYLLQKAPQAIVDLADNEKGQTALHKAAAYKRRDICCLLISAGASLLIQDKEGRTPCQLAGQDDPQLISYLESQQKFQEVAQQDLETPL